MNDSDIVERLVAEYTNFIDYSIDSSATSRRLRCGFCTRSYKYQLVLNQHVNSQHMTDLNQLTDQAHYQLILNFLYDRREILYPEYHQRFFMPVLFY